ncbi:MAG: DUF6056 family protein [Bacteroidota bacterium]|nr:DUF6056 family protein [Bacteroidota bacterium]
MKFYKHISEAKAESLQIGFLILMILPLLILYFFNHPTTEDFYFTETARELGFIDAQRFFLKFWGGRFTYFALISINPLLFKSIAGYNVLLFLIMISFFLILFLFIYQLTKNSLTFKEKLLFSLSVFFLYLYSMPSISQGFYCLGFSYVYHLGILLILVFFISYIQLSIAVKLSQKIFYSAICCLTAIAAAGCNELSAAIFLMTLLLLLLKSIIDKKINYSLLFFVVITSITVYIAFTAPGNSNRMEEYPDSHRFLFSIYNSGTFLLHQLIVWTFNSPLLAFTFLLIPIFIKIIEKSKTFTDRFSINPFNSIIILLAFVYSGIFIMMWSVGIPPYLRILNVLYFLFLLGWFYNMIVLFRYLDRKFNISNLKYPKYLNAIAYIIIIFFLIKENNITTAYSDLLSGAAKKFSNIMDERYNYILTDNSDTCKIDSIDYVPKTFFFMDINYEPKSVYNKGYSQYFNKKSVILKKTEN